MLVPYLSSQIIQFERLIIRAIACRRTYISSISKFEELIFEQLISTNWFGTIYLEPFRVICEYSNITRVSCSHNIIIVTYHSLIFDLRFVQWNFTFILWKLLVTSFHYVVYNWVCGIWCTAARPLKIQEGTSNS